MIHPSFLWLIAGVVSIALEAFGISGIGFFFAGLAALCVGVFVELAVIGPEQIVLQLAVFGLFTAGWAFLLWKPMRKFRLSFGGRSSGYSNIVGETAIVTGAGLTPRTPGNVVWSGTVMKAELSDKAGDIEVTVGSQVMIVAVRGATLVVDPK